MFSIGSPLGYDELKNLNENGTPPRTRIKDAAAVRAMFQKSWYSYQVRHRKNAIVKGLVDGNPPWPDKTKDGKRFEANFNNGIAYSFLENAITAFYDIYSEPQTYATCTTHYGQEEDVIWSEKLTDSFDWLLRQDDAGDFNIQLSLHEMVLYGLGPQVFLRPNDWRSQSVKQRSLYVADDAKANVADWEWCIFQWNYKVHELYDFIADEEQAKREGWNVEKVKESIMKAKPTSWGSVEWNRWENWQQALRDNDVYLGSQCAEVRMACMLFKEFSVDGAPSKISQRWVDLDGTTDEFLNEKNDVYDDFRQFLSAFYYDRGDGTHQSVKGLGVKMYALLTTQMRMQLKAVDAAMAATTVPVTSNLPAGRQSTSSIQLGPFTVLPNGFQFAPVNFSGVLDPALAMSEEMSRTLDNNLSQYRQKMELPAGNPPTKYQVQALLAQQATLGKTQIARYYQQLDELYTEKLRRAYSEDIPKGTKNKWMKLALEFQKKCKDSGLPRLDLKKVKVRASRIAGQGSAFMRQQSLTQLFATQFGQLNEVGRVNLSRDMIAATVGPELVSRYPVAGSGTEQTNPRMADQVWQAQVEHGLLFDSGHVQVTPTQNDVIHLDQHFLFCNEAAGSIQQGADPSTVFNTLVSTQAHIAQHLARLATDPSRRNEFNQYQEAFKVLAETINQLRAILEAQAQQNAPQQPTDPEMMKAQAKVQTDQFKAVEQTKIKQQKAMQDMDIKRLRTEQDLGINRLKAEQDMDIKEADAVMDIQTQQVENAGKLAQIQAQQNNPQFPVR